MAHCVAEYVQSDYLYLMKLRDGRIIGYSAEFEYGTSDISGATNCGEIEACTPERHSHVKWFGVPPEMAEDWVPATLAEIKEQHLDKYLIGWKADMNPAGTVNRAE